MRNAIALTMILCWGPAMAADPGEATYEWKPKKADDTVEIRVEKSRTIFAISSKSGIGGVGIRLKSGEWPRDVTLVLNKFSNAESFTLTSERIHLGAELGLSSGGIQALSGKMPFVFRNGKGEVKDEANAGTLAVVVEKGKDGLEIKLPANLFTGSKEVAVSWIDAYRR